jgi:hypothetical protein
VRKIGGDSGVDCGMLQCHVQNYAYGHKEIRTAGTIEGQNNDRMKTTRVDVEQYNIGDKLEHFLRMCLTPCAGS